MGPSAPGTHSPALWRSRTAGVFRYRRPVPGEQPGCGMRHQSIAAGSSIRRNGRACQQPSWGRRPVFLASMRLAEIDRHEHPCVAALDKQGEAFIGLGREFPQLLDIRYGVAIHGQHHVSRLNPCARRGTC